MAGFDLVPIDPPTVDSILTEIEAQCVALVEAFRVPTHAYLGEREYTVMQGLPRHAPVAADPFDASGLRQGPVKTIYTTCGSVTLLPHPASQLIAVGYMTPDYVADRPTATSQEQDGTYELVDALDDLHKTVNLPIVGAVKLQKLDNLIVVQIPQTPDTRLNFQQIQAFNKQLQEELPHQRFRIFIHAVPIRFLRLRKVAP